MPIQKIATCCYCGTRAALVLRGEDRHELTCSSCGAPLRDLKMLPKGAVSKSAAKGKPGRAKVKPIHANQPHPKAKKKKKQKKRKGLWGKIVEEAWDAVDDIFD